MFISKIKHREENLIERTYEKTKVSRLCKKSFAEGTKNRIRSKARLGLKLCESRRDQDRSEQWPQETERLALWGTMAAVFAHEAGNPLAGILLSLKCVESQLDKQQASDPSLISTIR